MFFFEEAYILTGVRRGRVWLLHCRRLMAGTPASVEADWRWALEREERSGDVVGFYHTHPPAAGTRPSRRDLRTMLAWCDAFGKPMLCVIGCGEALRTTRFYEEHGEALPLTERFPGGIIIALEGDEHGR